MENADKLELLYMTIGSLFLGWFLFGLFLVQVFIPGDGTSEFLFYILILVGLAGPVKLLGDIVN